MCFNWALSSCLGYNASSMRLTLVTVNQKKYVISFTIKVLTMFSRDESWGGKGSKNGTEDRPEGESRDRDDPYEGPAGMDPDGVIESNWDKVILCSKFSCPDL